LWAIRFNVGPGLWWKRAVEKCCSRRKRMEENFEI